MNDSVSNYKEWLKRTNHSTLSPREGNELDIKLKKHLKKELSELNKVTINEFYLLHKYQEVQDFCSKVDIDVINEVKKLLYVPTSFDDYKLIEPEVIYVHEGIDVPHTNIYGETTIRQLPNKDNLLLHWQIIRTLVSSSRNDSLLGRAIRFLVKDKRTNKYLGILCIGSGLPTVTVLNKEYDWNIEDEFVRGGKVTNTANGQVIIPVQPLGRVFQGGKLMALLTLSKPVVEKYEELYGQKLVAIHTTSLFGNKGISQYDNLKHFKNLGLTTGSSALKITDSTYKLILEWLKKRYPYQHYIHHVEKNEYGSLKMRDRKNRILITTFKKLGFKQTEYQSGHQRLVYNSFLYSNSKEFLSHQVKEHELVSAFDNSIEALTEYWKFGILGDIESSKSFKRKYKENEKRYETILRMKSGVKGHVNHLKKQGVQLRLPIDEWYGEIYNKSFSFMKKKYIKQVGR